MKHSKAIAHDLQEYHRAEEGTDKKSYEFLVAAVRRYLDRERLESNRERVERNLGASSSNAATAVGEKTGYIPKGYCVKWNKGTCTNDSCTYKHEKPPHQRRIVASQGPHQIEVGHHQGTRRARTKRNKFASSGNRDDALEVANADLAMRESSPDHPVLQRLLGRRRVTRRRREARVPAVERTVLLARRVPGVRETADLQRGMKVNRICLIASMLASVSNAFLIPPVDVICCPAAAFDANHDVYFGAF